MSISVAATWRPRGEGPRYRRLRPLLLDVYDQVYIALPAGVDEEDLGDTLALQEAGQVSVVEASEPGWERHMVLRSALAGSTTHIHSIDMDRLLHWVETYPDEWRDTVRHIQQTDFLVLGRTERAFNTHPEAMQDTESMVNLFVASHLGRSFDLCAGSRGFSRAAAEYVVEHSAPHHWGDAEWTIMLQRAGFALQPMLVEGLEWETPDQYRETVADAETQRRMAEAYDADATSWEYRLGVAREIIEEGLGALT